MAVSDSIQGSEIVKCRHGENGKFTESYSATPAGGMKPVGGGVPEQRATGRTMVPGKWDRGIHLFLLAEEGVSGSKRSPGGTFAEVPIMERT